MPEIIHRSFTIERSYPHPPAKVFSGFSDPKKKQRWFTGAEGVRVDDSSLDFTIGGFERTRFRFGDGPPMTNDTLYLDLVPDERIVFAYSMTRGGQPLSSSLATVELVRTAFGTRMRFTEHTAFLDGKDGGPGRREGTEKLFERLGLALSEP